ncbi:MAG: hypothetical protein DSY80_05355 [Desulfocapsa sp.]|nr:MAG: hypothetical protein DSY80_05355 [Desulfocapsa sp.]
MISDTLIKQLCRDKVCGVLATILSTDGLGPAQKGDSLLWVDGKRLAGTVGGGENEQKVLQVCAEFREKQQVLEIKSSLSGLLSSCGGTLEVRFEQLDFSDPEGVEVLKKQGIERTGSRLLLFGAGHVVQEVSWLADRNGFFCLVIDPRQDLMISAHFPVGTTLACCSVDNWLQKERVREEDYIIIAGPDHATDLAVLELAAGTVAHYIGVMGSSRKIASFTKILKKKSLYSHLTGRLFAPIGIDIPSRKPPEVAVSIVAELISVRAKSPSG